METHNILLKQCAEQKILLEAVLAKLDLLLKGGVGHIRLEETNGDINLPLKTIQDIEQLEENLKHEDNKKHLVRSSKYKRFLENEILESKIIKMQ